MADHAADARSGAATPAELRPQIERLIRETGGDPDSRDGRYVRDLVEASLGLIPDGRDTGEIKLLRHSLTDLRQAMAVFDGYADAPKVSIFGSARTPADHADYRSAVEFAQIMSGLGWLCITGAGDGIMKAGHEGSGRQQAFGLGIRLPFEQGSNSVIAGDNKLITFRNFFTRKTMFLFHSQALVVFPGGFGTQDEVMETLTLVQTGKNQMVPIVLLAGPRSSYWTEWDHYVHHELLDGGFISPHDVDLYYIARSPRDAAEHVLAFYRRYHSSRYVGDDFVIRLRDPLTDDQVAALNDEFGDLVSRGRIRQRGAYRQEEGELAGLRRLAFTHTKHDFGTLRRLIDRINSF